jgi:hypothetical protein
MPHSTPLISTIIVGLVLAFAFDLAAQRLRLPPLADADAMHMHLLNLVQRVPGGDQYLFRRAAPVGAGAAQIAFLDQRHFEPGLPRRHRDAKAGIASAQDQHVVAVACHGFTYRGTAGRSNAQELSLP